MQIGGKKKSFRYDQRDKIIVVETNFNALVEKKKKRKETDKIQQQITPGEEKDDFM